jgi:hypothetical protein
MTIEELNKLYNDALVKIVDIKFTLEELGHLVTQMNEELYLIKHREKIPRWLAEMPINEETL